MSKKISKKAAKKSVSKKIAGTSKSSKQAAKKTKVVKKAVAKKPVTKKNAPKKVVKKAAPKKKAVVTKKIAKPPVKKVSKPTPKKFQAKKAVPAKKTVKPAVKTKPVVVKKQKPAKPAKVEKQAKASKVAVTKSTSAKNLKPIFQPAKRNNPNVIQNEKLTPDPAGKFELEYIVHTSTPILFEFLTTPSGLSEWFCDDVNIRDNVYSFQWDDNAQKARLVKYIEEGVARFQWVDKTDDTYFEFRIERDDLTNDISLIVADFADTDEDKHSSTLLWNSQIDKLLHVLGSH